MKDINDIEQAIEDLDRRLKDNSIKGKLTPAKTLIVKGQINILEWVIQEWNASIIKALDGLTSLMIQKNSIFVENVQRI